MPQPARSVPLLQPVDALRQRRSLAAARHRLRAALVSAATPRCRKEDSYGHSTAKLAIVSLPAHALPPQFKTGNGNPPSSRRGGLLFHWETFSMGAAARNHIEVADLLDLAQVWSFDPDSSQGNASHWIKSEPPTLAKRNLVLMVIRNGTLRLISDQQRAVR